MAHSYDVGTRAWQPDPTEGWVASEVVKKLVNGDKVTLVFDLVNGEVNHIHAVKRPRASVGTLLIDLLQIEEDGRDNCGRPDAG